ncbi:organic solute transporter Ostalpha-domain-containing protein [Russula compacta]|nr:organic solute transporter Ostalpha-domain-containing protein [Russula compacta]
MSSNATCFQLKAPQKGPPLFQHGHIVFQAHDVGWVIASFFTIVATATSFWLINKHLQWYTNVHIIRLLLMVPIYASISLASYLFWDNATPLLLIRDAYEAILLTAFFYLLLTYLSPDREVQKTIFRKRGLSKEADAECRRRGQPRRKWKPQDGLLFLQLMKWGVLQYCVVRPTTTFVAVILNHIGLYCEESWSPAWGHIYISTIISISVTIAMYCLLQLYLCVATELAPHRPVLKMLSVKAVDTPYMTAEDINIGWGAIIETFEMSIFAFIHIKAFTYKPYLPLTPNAKRTPRLRSFTHAMDFRETFRELYASLVYMWHRMRGVETDPVARRVAVLENAFDKSRVEVWREGPIEAKEQVVEVDRAVEVEVNGERQWLGVGDEYCYGLVRRERSETLGIQFERELQKRGYGCSNLGQHGRKHRSRRRGAYEPVSQSTPHHEEPRVSSSPSKRKSHSRPTEQVRVYDERPPPSVLRTYRDNRTASQALSSGAKALQVFTNTVSQDVPGSPTQDRHPPQHANATIVRADTVLGRLFSGQPLQSDGGHTSLSGGASVIPPKSQSHRTHLPLNATPTVLPQNVDARRPVEVTTWHPASPDMKDAQELHAEPTVLLISPPPVQQPQERLDRGGAELSLLPPRPPPKSPLRSSHHRESARFQSSPAQANFTATPIMTVLPAPNIVSEPERIGKASRTEERSDHTGPHTNVRKLPDPQTPSAISHRPPRPRTYEATSSGNDVHSSRHRASMGVAVPTHTFIPESARWLRSKGTPRIMDRGMSPLLLRRSLPLDYNLSYLPNARSPPSVPRADQILSRHQNS